jgi:hypothetical protein
MIEKTLRKIAGDLHTIANEEVYDRAAIKLAATRLVAQAEMIERGLHGD